MTKHYFLKNNFVLWSTNVYSFRDNYPIINLPISKINYKNNLHLLKNALDTYNVRTDDGSHTIDSFIRERPYGL